MRVRISPNYTANIGPISTILRSDAMTDVLRAAGEVVASRARSLAPSVTGSYRESIHVVTEVHPSRAVAHVVADARHAMAVEARQHVLRRSLG
jgi:hypothetical protein